MLSLRSSAVASPPILEHTPEHTSADTNPKGHVCPVRCPCLSTQMHTLLTERHALATQMPMFVHSYALVCPLRCTRCPVRCTCLSTQMHTLLTEWHALATQMPMFVHSYVLVCPLRCTRCPLRCTCLSTQMPMLVHSDAHAVQSDAHVCPLRCTRG